MKKHAAPSRLGLAVTLVLMATASAALADGLRAQISADKVGLGDSFQLMLSADPAKLTAPPDVSALNTDFDILGTSKSTQTQIINGARTDNVQWTITLAPRAKGHLTIPVLNAGQASSQALAIEVVAQAELPADQQTNSSTTVEATVEPGSHYVQQEIPVTLRITAGQGFRGGSIAAPDSPAYILEQRGEDKTSQVTRNGQAVTVIERDYMLRPQQSGTLTIAPFVLRGSEEDTSAAGTRRQSPFESLFGGSAFGGAGSPFDQMFNPGREVLLRTAPITLEVKASPTKASEWFLPAKAVTLTSKWVPKSPTLRVGEAASRHVRLQALGATQVQLPDLALPQVSGAKIYSEGSNAGSVDTPDGTAAVRDFSYSIVPTSGGTITLPEVEVKWFDTATETEKTARLPAETVNVDGPVTAPPVQAFAQTPTAAAVQPPAVAQSQNRPLIFAALAAIGVISLGALALWSRKRGAAKPAVAGPTLRDQRKAALAQISHACAAFEAKAAYAAGVVWLRSLAKDMKVSQEAVLQADPALAREWALLEAHVFGVGAATTWDAQAFRQQVLAAEHRYAPGAKPQRKTRVPALYPGISNAEHV